MGLLPYIILSVMSVTPTWHIRPMQYTRFPTLQYYITSDYVIAISHPPTSPAVVREYVDGQWVSRSDDNSKTVDVIEYNGKVYSSHFRVEIISQRDLLMRIINGWGTEYNYYDLAMLARKWNGDGRFTLESAADILSGVWLRNDYAN